MNFEAVALSLREDARASVTEIDLDASANTAPTPGVIRAVVTAMSKGYGNPSSDHGRGDAARRMLADARDALSEVIGGTSEDGVIFTSGCTEANNLVLRSFSDPSVQIITTAVEHPSVLAPVSAIHAVGGNVVILGVDAHGRVDLDELRKKTAMGPSLVSIQLANSETGVLQDSSAIATIVAGAPDCFFHGDAAQAVGKIDVTLGRGRCRKTGTYSVRRRSLRAFAGFLPSPRARWCTRIMKIAPFERFIGSDRAYSYIGIRADENRAGYLGTGTAGAKPVVISEQPNITPVYPYRDDYIDVAEVGRIFANEKLYGERLFKPAHHAYYVTADRSKADEFRSSIATQRRRAFFRMSAAHLGMASPWRFTVLHHAGTYLEVIAALADADAAKTYLDQITRRLIKGLNRAYLGMMAKRPRNYGWRVQSGAPTIQWDGSPPSTRSRAQRARRTSSSRWTAVNVAPPSKYAASRLRLRSSRLNCDHCFSSICCALTRAACRRAFPANVSRRSVSSRLLQMRPLVTKATRVV